jgi:crotonobetainyl-CoA:carnitine CoA-transferase CaiB-like acyl-CoA transferase
MSLPLDGIRVLDLTRAAAGPFCTMILGDFGADVTKVEPCPKGDLLRPFGPFDQGEGTYFLSINRNKRSLALNFRHPDGPALLRELAAKADVLVENFKPGVMTDLGMSYELLRAANSRLIFASVTGFGTEGPYGTWPGVDQIAQGMSGFMSITGTESSGPVRVGVPIGDLTAGMWAALGVLAAVVQRQQTGQGQRVDVSLLGALIGLLCVQGQRYLSLGDVPGPVGTDHPVICPYGMVETADGPMNICVATESMWASLCKILGLEELVDEPAFADNDARLRNRDELKAKLNAAFASGGQLSWAEKLNAAGIPAGPVYRMDQVFNDPHVREGGFVEEITHPTIGTLTTLANPARVESLSGRSVRTPPPLLGAHSRDILRDFGIPDGRVEALLTSGVVEQRVMETTDAD